MFIAGFVLNLLSSVGAARVGAPTCFGSIAVMCRGQVPLLRSSWCGCDACYKHLAPTERNRALSLTLRLQTIQRFRPRTSQCIRLSPSLNPRVIYQESSLALALVLKLNVDQ